MKYKPLTLASAVKMHTQRNYSFWLPRMTSIWSIAQCGIWTVGMYIEGKRKLKRSLMVDFAHVLFHRIEYVRSFKQIFTAKKPQHSLYWLDLKIKSDVDHCDYEQSMHCIVDKAFFCTIVAFIHQLNKTSRMNRNCVYHRNSMDKIVKLTKRSFSKS